MKLKKLLGYLLVTSLATSMLFSTTVMASSNIAETKTVGDSSWDAKDLGPISPERVEWYRQRGYTDEEAESIHYYSVKVEYDKEAARKGAELLNEFRTSDTWYRDDGSKGQNLIADMNPTTGKYIETAEHNRAGKKEGIITVSGLNALKYDYGLEKIAMERAADCVFRMGHTRPDDETRDELLYESLGISFGTGENAYYEIAYIYEAEDAQKAWEEEIEKFSGQGHRRAMLYERYTHVGLGVVHYGDLSICIQTFSRKATGITEDQGYDGVKTKIAPVETYLLDPDAYCIFNTKHRNNVVIPKLYYNTLEGQYDNNNTGDNTESTEEPTEEASTETPESEDEYEYFEYSPDFLSESYFNEVIKEVNKFRTSDTWYYDESNNKVPVKGLKALKKDNGLEEIAKQRIAELIFKYDGMHLKPNGCKANEVYFKMVVDGIYDDIYASECIGWRDGSDRNNHASVKTLVNGWIEENCDYNNQVHRRSLLDKNVKYIGSAVAFYNGYMIEVITMSDQPTGREEASNSKKFTVEVSRGQYSTDSRDWLYGDTVIPSGAKAVEAPRDPNWDIPKGCKAVADDPDDQDDSDNPYNPDDPGNPDDPYNPYDPSNPNDPSNPVNPDDPSNPVNPDNSGNSGNNESTSPKLIYKSKTDISSLIQGTGVKVKYSSSNKKVAKINSKGIATGGKQAGTATITKYIKETKKSAWTEVGSITVTNYNPTLPKKETLTIGNTIDLNEKLTGSDEVPVSWESSNTGAVTVTADGIATAVGQGSAKISPVFSTGKSKAKIKIKVPKN